MKLDFRLINVSESFKCDKDYYLEIDKNAHDLLTAVANKKGFSCAESLIIDYIETLIEECLNEED